MISKETAEHYFGGDQRDGWRLAEPSDAGVSRVPRGRVLDA